MSTKGDCAKVMFFRVVLKKGNVAAINTPRETTCQTITIVKMRKLKAYQIYLTLPNAFWPTDN